MKILIADDDPVTRTLLRSNLEAWEHDVTEAENGRDALGHIQSSPDRSPELAILDWEMPGYSGPELCDFMRSNNTTHYVYILLLTVRKSRNDIWHGFDSGADDYLLKPVNIHELQCHLKAGRKIIDYEHKLRDHEFKVRVECYNALTELAEMRDNETGQHLKRLSEYSRILGRTLNLDAEMIRQLSLFAPMHDIGKVGIADSILHYPGPLSPESWKIMKTHTTLGHSILDKRPTLEMAAQIALSHHEKYDGSGYPNGLAKEEIPLYARIVSLADVYDALRSKRPYKEPWEHKKVKEFICSRSGSDFDPNVVEAFMKNEQLFDLLFSSSISKDISEE